MSAEKSTEILRNSYVTPIVILPILILIVLLMLPIYVGNYVMHMLILIFLYAYLGQSWNILSGYAGQLSLGHATFFGIGAYTSTLLFMHLSLTPWVGMFAGAILAALCAIVISFLSFHFGLKTHFFALATIAFAEIFRFCANTFQGVGGAQGLLIPLKGNSPLLYQFVEKAPYYYIALAMMLLSMGVVYLLQKSKYGFYFIAIRENEESAKALGINTLKFKIVATTISAALTALGGTFYAQYVMFVDPHGAFSTNVSIDIILRPIIGGMGTIFGPVLGSFVISPLSEIIQLTIGVGRSGVYMMVYGLILIIICLLMPNGIYPYLKKWLFRK